MNMIQKELESLFVNGLLNPADIIASAENPSSPLHTHFEWDDSTAARLHRLEQARMLIRSVVISHPDNSTIQIRAYVSIPSDRNVNGGYRKIDDVMTNDFMLAQFRDEINKQIGVWERKSSILGFGINFVPLKKLVKKTVRK